MEKEAERDERLQVKGLDVVDMEVDAQTLADGFDPEESAWDRRLLYEVTGISIRDQEFCGDTSSEEEPGTNEAAVDDERLARPSGQ